MSEYIKAGKFKAECLRVMDKVKKTKKGIIITKRNVPVARLMPIETEEEFPIFGCMEGTITIKGGITKPIGEDWDVLD